jgi:hypothetical protein
VLKFSAARTNVKRGISIIPYLHHFCQVFWSKKVFYLFS